MTCLIVRTRRKIYATMGGKERMLTRFMVRLAREQGKEEREGNGDVP